MADSARTNYSVSVDRYVVRVVESKMLEYSTRKSRYHFRAKVQILTDCTDPTRSTIGRTMDIPKLGVGEGWEDRIYPGAVVRIQVMTETYRGGGSMEWKVEDVFKDERGRCEP